MILAEPFAIDAFGRIDVSDLAAGASLVPAGSAVTLSAAAWSLIHGGPDVIEPTRSVLRVAAMAARQHLGRSLCEFATACPRRRFRLRIGRTLAGHCALAICLPWEQA